MKNKDLTVFILTNGRPDNVVTIKTLRNQGYTGKIFLLVDDLDKTKDRYIENYGNQVVIFNKQEIADKTDQGDNFNDLRTITHARNASFEVARKIGVTYFIQLDDDYTAFRYRYIDDKYHTKLLKVDIGKYFNILLDFYKNTPQITTLCMSQGGDFIGGEGCGMLSNYHNSSRKSMNSFICSVNRPFKFLGRMNEDVNTYTTLGRRGVLFLTVPYVSLEQKATQSNPGGITDTYLQYGTYVKSFFTVMFGPSSVKIATMGAGKRRIHHAINWKKTSPQILRQEIKK